jgi:hypothetical protein
MDKIIQMIMKVVMRQLISRGVKTGINYASRGGSDNTDPTPGGQGQSQDAKALAKRARQAANTAKRLGR